MNMHGHAKKLYSIFQFCWPWLVSLQWCVSLSFIPWKRSKELFFPQNKEKEKKKKMSTRQTILICIFKIYISKYTLYTLILNSRVLFISRFASENSKLNAATINIFLFVRDLVRRHYLSDIERVVFYKTCIY